MHIGIRSALRSALVPESELAGFGARPPRLDAWLELFFRETVRGEPERLR